MSGTSYRAGRNDWMDEALCWWLTGDEFHPNGIGGSAYAAKQACQICPVRTECLTYAMRTEIGHREGVYGGTTPTERHKLARRGWKPGDPTPPVHFTSRRAA